MQWYAADTGVDLDIAEREIILIYVLRGAGSNLTRIAGKKTNYLRQSPSINIASGLGKRRGGHEEHKPTDRA